MTINDRRELENWSIAAYEQKDWNMRWRVVATHDTGQTHFAEGMDLETALLWLAKKACLDRDRLKSLYGL